jgi:predicted O-methyltransferase YrrM
VTGAPFLAEYEARLAGPWTDIQDQLPMLYERACRYPRVRVLEFGVRTGESTSAWLAAAELTGGSVRSYDIETPAVPAWWRELDRWCFTQGSSLDAQPGAGECDVLFLDTSHAYDDTLRELARWVPHVVPGGLVLCHDTQLTGPPFEPLAVARALDGYCASTGLEWRELGGHYGLGEITIGKGDGNGLPGGAGRRGRGSP